VQREIRLSTAPARCGLAARRLAPPTRQNAAMRSGWIWPRCRAALGGITLVATMLAACGDASGDQKGGGMFGFLKGSKEAPAASRVAPEVGAVLVRASAFPAAAGTAAAVAFGDCGEAAVRGQPPAAAIVDRFVPGESVLGYRVGAQGGVPALVFFDVPGRQPRFEIWELGPGAAPAFVKARPVQLGEAQARWAGFNLAATSCLPGGRLALAVHYADPGPKDALYLYDTAAQQFRLLGRIEPDASRLPLRYFDVLPAGADAALLRYGSDGVRVAAETYARGREHLLLFSPRHPQGLEVLDLALADGNVRRWGLVGKTLWLETEDIRARGKPNGFVWSLDLSRVL
jgi:hypothetical protein